MTRKTPIAAWLVLLSASHLSAQIVGIPKPADHHCRNDLGFGASGPFLDKDAHFWGVAIDYGRFVAGPSSVPASFAFDRETETLSSRGKKKTDSLSAVGLDYGMGRHTLTTGLSKGVASTDNSQRPMRFASGDWGTGIVAGWSFVSLPRAVQDSVSLSVGHEYNLSQKESDITFDFGCAFAF